MENNQNLNNGQENWQQVINETAENAAQAPQQQAQTAQQYAQAPQQYAQAPQQYAQAPQQYAQAPQQYAQAPQQYAQAPQQYAQAPQQYAQAPQQYAQAPQQYAQAPQQYAQAPQQYAQAPAYDADSFAVMPAKKKKSVLPIILIIAAAAIIVGGLIFCFFTFFNKGTGYESIERGYFAKLDETVESLTVSGQEAKQIKLTIAPGASLTGGTQLAPTVLNCTSYSDGAKIGKGTFTLAADQNSYLTLNMWTEDQNLYLQIPELSDAYIKTDIQAISSLSTNFSTDSIVQDMVTTAPMMESISSSDYAEFQEILADLDPAVVESLLNDLSNAYFEVFSDPAKTTENLTSGDVTVSCDAYTVSFTYEKVFEFAKKAIEKIQNNSDAMAIIEKLGATKSDIAGIATYLDQYKKMMPEEELNKELLKMVIYVKDNQLVGRSIYSQDTEVLRLIHLNTSDKFAFELTANSSDDTVSIVASGTKSGNKYTGTASAVSEEETVMSAAFDIEIGEYTNGTASFDVNTDDGTSTLYLTISEDADSAKLDVDFSTDGQSVIKLSLETSDIPYEAVTIPEMNADNCVEINADGTFDTTTGAGLKFTTDAEANVEKFLNKFIEMENPDIIAYFIKAAMAGSSADF